MAPGFGLIEPPAKPGEVRNVKMLFEQRAFFACGPVMKTETATGHYAPWSRFIREGQAPPRTHVSGGSCVSRPLGCRKLGIHRIKVRLHFTGDPLRSDPGAD